MSDSDTPATGPQTLHEAVEEKFPDPVETEAPEAEAEAAPDAASAEDVQVDAAVDAEGAEEAPEDKPADADPRDAPEEPQHLDMDTYGDLTVAVMVDGQEKRIPLTDATKGYQRQADYTRKTEALANERKAIEAERGQMQADYAEKERQLLTQLSQTTEAEPDWVALSKEDPLGYVEKRAEWDAKKVNRDQAQARLQQQAAAQMHVAMQENLTKLASRRPEWSDPKVAEKARVEMITGGEKYYGLAPQEMNATIDHRLIEMLSDAVAYRRLKEGDTTRKRVVRAPKVIKPGASTGAANVKDEKQAAAKRKRAKPHTMQEHLESLGLS